MTREKARIRKLNQLRHDPLLNVEPFLRITAAATDYQDHVTIAWPGMPSYAAAYYLEMLSSTSNKKNNFSKRKYITNAI